MVASVRRCIGLGIALILGLCLLVVAVPGQALAASKAPSITVQNASTGKVVIKKGSTYKLGVKAPKAKVSYKSSKPSVVKVTKKGKIKGLKAGKATITIKAKKGKLTTVKKIKVTVSSARKYKAVKGVKVNVPSTKLTVGQTAKIKTTFKPKGSSNKNLIYKTSNSKVVAVSASGVVTAKSKGTATVTVTSAINKKAKKTIKFQVSAKPSSAKPSKPSVPLKVGVTSVGASADEDVLLEDEVAYIDVTVYPQNATNKSVVYSSSNKGVLTVDSDGCVRPVAPGAAKVTVTSADNPQAKATVAFTVVPSEYDEEDDADPDVIDAVEIDPYYDNRVEYADGAKIVENAEYALNDDGSVSVARNMLPTDLKNGDIVVFEPTAINPGGAAIKVNDSDLDDGVLEGRVPEVDEIYKEIDIESYAGVAETDFVPEEGVEIVGSEEVGMGEADPINVMMVYPDASNVYSAASGAALGKSASQIARNSNLGEGDSIELFTVGGGGKSTSKFDFKYKGVTFTVKLTGKVKYDYDLWGLNELYVGVEAENSVGIKGSVSDIFGAEDVDKKLGTVVFSTPVPGLLLEGSVWFHLGADGEINLSVESSCEAGVRYTESQGIKVVTDNSTRPSLKTSAEVNTGFDFTGTLSMLSLAIADPSINVRFKLGVDTGNAKVRTNGMRCNDVKLKFAPSISIGKHEGLLKSMGISYSKNITELTLKKWHLENGNLVNKCTWKGNFKQYDNAGSLLPVDGGMGSWGSGDALRITLRWGAHPEDLDSHLFGPSSDGEFHVYYGDDEYREGGVVKAFLDVDDTEGFGYETTTVYNAKGGIYHFMVHLFNGSGTIGTSNAVINVYKGNRLLKSFTPPANLDDEDWYVFAYDAGSNTFHPYSYKATDYDYYC